MDIRGDVGCGAGLMVAASGERGGEEQREEAETHSACLLLSHWGDFARKKSRVGNRCFTRGLAGKVCCRGWFFDGENVVVGW